jgi:hypothetical protein
MEAAGQRDRSGRRGKGELCISFFAAVRFAKQLRRVRLILTDVRLPGLSRSRRVSLIEEDSDRPQAYFDMIPRRASPELT